MSMNLWLGTLSIVCHLAWPTTAAAGQCIIQCAATHTSVLPHSETVVSRVRNVLLRGIEFVNAGTRRADVLKPVLQHNCSLTAACSRPVPTSKMLRSPPEHTLMLATCSALPCTSPSTVLEVVLRHQPASPSRCACSAVFARKKTPCTLQMSALCMVIAWLRGVRCTSGCYAMHATEDVKQGVGPEVRCGNFKPGGQGDAVDPR